ncbi:MAG: hypothetical protein KDC87_19345 [Planctomycetes bacterium]|nr:hypothetical protein [Planctomycetota bacterium]MCB9872033.1 hypothetical protein [Planctomycetota bacterium]MCB9888435.1 hypothetical protein [Planctomycetota bacterium]
MTSRTLLLLAVAGPLAAQSAVVPPVFAQVRGNDALSLPLRWHEGLLQVHLKSQKGVGRVLPDAMLDTMLKEIRVRRPSFLEEPAYGALTRTFTVRLANTNLPLMSMIADMEANRTAVVSATGANGPTTLTTVVQAKSFNIAATPKAGYREAVGKDLLQLPFASPFAFKGPDLFVDWETTSTSTLPDPNGWVDALVLQYTGDQGIVVTLGQGGCSSVVPSSGLPMSLEGEGERPAASSKVTLRLRNALPSATSMLFLGPRPLLPRTSQTGYKVYDPMVGYLTTISRPECHVWTSPLTHLVGATDGAGSQDFALPIPALLPAQYGTLYVLQAAVLDTRASRLELSNGVGAIVGAVEIQSRASTVMSPKPWVLDSNNQRIAPVSPWGPMNSSLPILWFGW